MTEPTVIWYDDDEPPGVETCRDCTTPATCTLYERCVRSDESLLDSAEDVL
jgi:hypothetical protein